MMSVTSSDSSVKLSSSCAGPAGSSGIGRVLPEAGGDAEGGTGSEGEPGDGEGAGEEGAAGPAPGARDAARQTEEDRAAAPRRPAGGLFVCPAFETRTQRWISVPVCPSAGGAARRSAGDASAEEPAAAGGEHRPQREDSQLRKVH